MVESLQNLVDSIVASTAGLPSPEALAQWDPAPSGVMDLCIAADGRWIHEGREIRREGLVRLFASILRREEDGNYYLVTPVEKWQVSVERHALQVVDCVQESAAEGAGWYALLNTGGRCRISAARPVHPADGDDPPWIDAPNGLSARISRPAWYRLVEAADLDGDRVVIHSAGEVIDLGAAS